MKLIRSGCTQLPTEAAEAYIQQWTTDDILMVMMMMMMRVL